MKRFLSLAFVILAFAGIARAQGQDEHWTFDPGTYPDMTYVYATLQLGSTYITREGLLREYEFAAFIGDEVRSNYQLEAVTTAQRTSYIIRFAVYGDLTTEKNSKITFRAWKDGAEYNLTSADEVQFTGETEGIPSNPVALSMIELTNVTLNNIVMNVGESVNLTDYLTLTPENATLPNNITWTIVDPGYFTISGNTLTATALNTNGAGLNVSVGGKVARGMVAIYQPATKLERTQAEITVNVGDNVESLLGNSYTLTPSNSTDRVKWSWEIEETEIIDQSFNAVNPGDIVLTGILYDGATDTERDDISPINVTIHVVQPVTGIRSVHGINCRVGDDLTPYLVDGTAFLVQPANASNKEVTFVLTDDAVNILSIDNGTVTAIGKGRATLYVRSAENPRIYTRIPVTVYNDYRTLTAIKDMIGVMLTDETTVDISEQVWENVTPGPETADTYYGTLTAESNNTEVVEVTVGDVYTITAKSEGEATITVSMPVKDWLKASFSDDQDFVTNVTASFKVVVSMGLSGLEIECPELVMNIPSSISIKPVPETASFDDYANLTITARYEGNETWRALDTGDLLEGVNGSVDCMIFPRIPGNITITVSYDNNGTVISTTTDPIAVGYPYEAVGGWQWQTIPFGYPENIDGTERSGLYNIYGDNLVEIRTQDLQLYNDPEFGYFGDLDLLTQNRCLKVKMEEDSYISYNLFDGYLGATEDIILRKGWNWIPNPYIFSRTLENAFDGDDFFVGDRIVSKDDGFAEYTETGWTGTLKTLTPGKGYMFYSMDDNQLNYAYELNMNDDDDEAAAIQGAPRRVAAGQQRFSYNPSRFRDNMTIVSRIEGIEGTDRYSVIAFVNDECRGEGKMVDDLMFITVHANAGEQVSFKLYDTLTDRLYDIDQTVGVQMMLGTVKAPVLMSSLGVTTGISDMERGSASQQQVYDLSGRLARTASQGVQLVRRQDGTVRKVVKK